MWQEVTPDLHLAHLCVHALDVAEQTHLHAERI